MGALATLPMPSRGPQHFKVRGKMRLGPQMGGLATSSLPSREVPNTSMRKTKSKVAHKWAHCLHHPCRLGGGPQRFKAGHKVESGSQ